MAKATESAATPTRCRPAASRRVRAAVARVVIEAVEPEVDGGRFPIKRTVGEEVVGRAPTCFADGHDVLAAVVLWRRAGEPSWTRGARWRPLGNDAGRAASRSTALGATNTPSRRWVDRFATWRQELTKKAAAGQDVASELLEGAAAAATRLRARRPRYVDRRTPAGSADDRRARAQQRPSAARCPRSCAARWRPRRPRAARPATTGS